MRFVLVALAAAVLAVYLGLGLIDVAHFPQVLMLVLYLALALVALLVLRIGLHLALLHEAHDEIQSDEPLAVYVLRSRRSGHGVLSCVRGGDASVIAFVTQVPAGRAPGA